MTLFLKKQLFKQALYSSIKNQKLNLSYQTKLNDLKVPGFKVNSKDIFIITEPTEFHAKLLVS